MMRQLGFFSATTRALRAYRVYRRKGRAQLRGTVLLLPVHRLSLALLLLKMDKRKEYPQSLASVMSPGIVRVNGSKAFHGEADGNLD